MPRIMLNMTDSTCRNVKSTNLELDMQALNTKSYSNWTIKMGAISFKDAKTLSFMLQD